MKTLNEVIKALEKCMTDDAIESEGFYLATDALHYLKEYQRWQDIMEETPSYYDFVKMENSWKEQKEKDLHGGI